MADNIKSIFRLYGLIFAKVRCIPFKWNSENQRLCLYQTSEAHNRQQNVRFEKQRQSIQLNVHRLAGLLLLVQQVLSKEYDNLASKILNWFTVAVIPAHNIALFLSQTKCEEIVGYINGLFQYLERLSPQMNHGEKRKFTEKVNMLVATGFAPSVFIVPVCFVFGLHWSYPYGKASLVGFWLLGQDETRSSGTLVKLGVFMFNYWIWTIGMVAGICYVGGIICLSTILLTDCIRTFRNMEIRNSNNVPFEERTKLYRQIQVLGILQTEVNAIILTSFLIFLPLVLIPSTTVVIHRLPWTSDQATVILLCCYIAGNSIFAITFIVGLQAGVWYESTYLHEQLKRLAVQRRSMLHQLELKLHKRFWTSCQNLIKVKFGVNNFVDEKTALNCMNLAVSVTVQLLLLKQ